MKEVMKLICNVFGCSACAWLLDAMGIQSFKTFHLFASLFFSFCALTSLLPFSSLPSFYSFSCSL